MIVLPLILGLFFMLASYVLLSLAGTTLLSYCSKKLLATIYLFFSTPARLRKQAGDFQNKQEILKKIYVKKTKLIWKKTIFKQQFLHDKNTKAQIRILARSTKKQLLLCRKNLSQEELKDIQQSIKQCVAQLEMTELLDINFRLTGPNRFLHFSLTDIQNRQ